MYSKCTYSIQGNFVCSNMIDTKTNKIEENNSFFAIEKFESISFQEHIYNKLNNDEKFYLQNTWNKCFSNNKYEWYEYGKIILIKKNNKIIGYVGYLTSNELCNWLMRDNMFAYKDMYGITTCNENDIYIYNLCILPQFRRQQYASKIMKYIMNKFKSNIFLYTESNNLAAINLYKSLQFYISKKVNTANGVNYIMKYRYL